LNLVPKSDSFIANVLINQAANYKELKKSAFRRLLLA
jgi:hypothetical protein